MSDKLEAVDPATYWTVLPSSTDWGLNAVSTDGYHGAYIKGDGCTHVWEYRHPKEDMSTPSPQRIVLGEGEYLDEDAIYRHVCDLDAEITRLLALREIAIRHFEAEGGATAREEWYYGKPFSSAIITVPPRHPEEQQAIFAGFAAERHRDEVQSYARLGVAEEDIQQVVMIGCEDGIYTVRLRDGRTWHKAQEVVERNGA